MDLERDILRNYVQARLNQKLADYGVRVEFIDLRHSIHTDKDLDEAQREKLIFNICIDEIDSCRPYFIGFIGHRYGWIPPENRTSDKQVELDPDFPLSKQELSVTVFEFLHGVWNKNNTHRAFLFLRNEDSYRLLKDEERKIYIDSGENYARIERLRDYARRNSHDVEVVEYTLNPSSGDSSDWENWANDITDRIFNSILRDIDNDQTSMNLLPYFRMQRNFIVNKISGFEGRQELIDNCMASLKRREALYLHQDAEGMGNTSLLCMLYTLMKEDDNYFCLFNASEIDPTCGKWANVFYHWNMQLAQFLGDDHSGLDRYRDDATSLFQLYCIYCRRVYTEKNRKVAVFVDDAFNMDGYFSIKQAFTLLSQTLPTGAEGMQYLNPVIVEPLDSDDISAITRNIRPGVVADLLWKPSVNNVRWLVLAVNILKNLNKQDYLSIRSSEQKGNEEQNITKYLLSIVDEMPDDYENLCLYWIDRLKIILGDEFVGTYITAMMNCYGLSDESLAVITGHNIDWCVYFRHLLGDEIISESVDGLYHIQPNLRNAFRLYYEDAHIAAVFERLDGYLGSVSPDSPVYVNNIFAVNLYKENIGFLAEYISDPANYRPDNIRWAPIRAFNEFASTEPQRFKLLIDRLINEAQPTYALFRYLERWSRQLAEINRGDWISHLRTCETLIDRLTRLDHDDALSNDTKRALVEILLQAGGVAVELEDSEDLWDDFNHRALTYALQHLDESADWDALICEALYDRYEGFTDIRKRWEFLDTHFRPLEDRLYRYENPSNSLAYIRLLRDLAILDGVFSDDSDPSVYCIKAMRMALRHLDDTASHDFDDYGNNALFCASCSLKVLSESKATHTDEVLRLVAGILEKIIPTCDKYTRWSRKISNLAHLAALYSEATMGIDLENAVHTIDRVLDIIVSTEEPDEVDINPEFMSQAMVRYTSIRIMLGHGSDTTDYLDIGVAWCLSARMIIESYKPGAVNKYSRYTYFDDDFEIVMRLADLHNDNIWERELDPSFPLSNAIFAKIMQSVQNQESFDKREFMELYGMYMDIYNSSKIHYRHISQHHAAVVNYLASQVNNESTQTETSDSEEDGTYSLEELEEMIEAGDYGSIITSMAGRHSGRPDEYYYLALAHLRSGDTNLAIDIFRMLSNEQSLPEGFRLSSKVNLLFSLLAGGDTDGFMRFYSELDEDTRNDSDVQMLFDAYSAISNNEEPQLPQQWGFLL